MKIIAGILLGIWLVLILLGKGGFVHLLLLNGIALVFVELVKIHRNKVIAD